MNKNKKKRAYKQSTKKKMKMKGHYYSATKKFKFFLSCFHYIFKNKKYYKIHFSISLIIIIMR